jgi:hypothetical protein
MFVTADLQTIFTEDLEVQPIYDQYPVQNRHAYSPKVLFVFTTKPNAKYRPTFHAAAILLFHIP